MFIVDRLADTGRTSAELSPTRKARRTREKKRRVIARLEELRAEKEEREEAVERALATAIDIEPALIPATPAPAPVPIVVAPVHIASIPTSRTSLSRAFKTPRKKGAPRKIGLRTRLVRDLRKEQRELKKRLKEVNRDLKSLHA